MAEIRLDHVSFMYPNGYTAVEDASLLIPQGQTLAILGQNGAGKTTTVKMMNNLTVPTKGNVYVGDKNTRDHTTAQIARQVGYVFQNPDDQIFHATVYAEVEYGPKISLKLPEDQVKARTKDALKKTGLWKLRNENPFDLPLSIRKFITVAAVLAMDCEVIILDEPTAGQDLYGIELLHNIIADLHAQGKTVVTITHDIEFAAENFQRIIVMAHRQILKDGTPEEVFADEPILNEAMLKKPCPGRLACRLNMHGGILTNEQFVDAFCRIYEQGTLKRAAGKEE